MTGLLHLKFATSFRFSFATRAFSVAALLIFLSACADPAAYRSHGKTAFGEGQPTGATTQVYDSDEKKIVSTGYVAAGSKEKYVQIEQAVIANLDNELASSIEDVNITPLDQNGHLTRTVPAQLKVLVRFKQSFLRSDMPVEFDMTLAKDTDRLAAKNVAQVKPANQSSNVSLLRASATCLDSNCEQVDLRVEREPDSTKTGGTSLLTSANLQAGLLYSFSHPTAQLLQPKSNKKIEDRSLLDIQDRLARGAEVTQESFSVIGGASKSKVKIAPNEIGASAFEFETPVVDTGDVTPQIEPGGVAGNSRKDVRVLGIDPETSDMMVEVSSVGMASQIEDDGTYSYDQPTFRMTISNTKPSAPAGEPAVGGEPLQILPSNEPVTEGKGFFPTTPGDEAIAKQTARMAHYGNDSFVQKMIHKNNNAVIAKTDQASERTPKVSPYIVRVFESLGMTPDFAYTMMSETQYLVDGNPLAVTTSDPKGSAFGPWQILNGTALAIKKLSGRPFLYSAVRGVGKARKAPAADDRGYVIQSTYMAASYLNYIMKTYNFEDEPIMAIVGYNRGDGYAQKASRTFNARFKNYKINFEMARKYKMINAAGLEYAHRFLAFREVGQNPEKYGLSAVVQSAPDRTIRRLSRPGAPLPPNYFNEKIKSL